LTADPSRTQDFIICIEMAGFAVVHHFIYSYKVRGCVCQRIGHIHSTRRFVALRISSNMHPSQVTTRVPLGLRLSLCTSGPRRATAYLPPMCLLQHQLSSCTRSQGASRCLLRSQCSCRPPQICARHRGDRFRSQAAEKSLRSEIDHKLATCRTLHCRLSCTSRLIAPHR